MLNNLNSERIMEAREIYHILKSIVEPIHAHIDQMVAIAKWIEAEFEYKPQKQANGVKQSDSNSNIPIVRESLLEKYIKHVGQCEGITFVSKCNDGYSSDVKFSDEELKILERLS